MIKELSSEIEEITTHINKLIEEDAQLKSKKEVLKTVHGVGDIVAFELYYEIRVFTSRSGYGSFLTIISYS